jgi:hypothetical protein
MRFLLLVLLVLSLYTVTANHDHDQELAVMKKEIDWGRNEMERYKALRGSWPVRTSEGPTDEITRFIRKNPVVIDRTPELSVWEFLVSML